MQALPVSVLALDEMNTLHSSATIRGSTQF